MRIVIIGAGEVGAYLARYLVAENHDISLIDNNAERVQHINDHLDIETLRALEEAVDTDLVGVPALERRSQLVDRRCQTRRRGEDRRRRRVPVRRRRWRLPDLRHVGHLSRGDHSQYRRDHGDPG